MIVKSILSCRIKIKIFTFVPRTATESYLKYSILDLSYTAEINRLLILCFSLLTLTFSISETNINIFKTKNWYVT